MPITSIEWTDLSWPVVNGCRRISPGCGGAHGVGGCYAERLAATRLAHTSKYQGLAVFGQNGPHWTGKARLWPSELAMPLRRRQPSKIFVADMGDLFFEEVPNETIAAVFGVMLACPRHVFQVLTKRADRLPEWYGWAQRYAAPSVQSLLLHHAQRLCDHRALRRDVDAILARPWPLPNLWLGVSVESQRYADERIPHLLSTPAAVHFVSYEPALGPVDFEPWLGGRRVEMDLSDPPRVLSDEPAPRLDWAIGGSESGPGARPCDPAWLRAAADACLTAGVAFFTKQIATETGRAAGVLKGGDPAHWPPGVWPRQFPQVHA